MRCDDVMSHHRDDEKARGRGRKQWGWLEQREKYRSRKPQAVLEGTRAASRQQQEQGGEFQMGRAHRVRHHCNSGVRVGTIVAGGRKGWLQPPRKNEQRNSQTDKPNDHDLACVVELAICPVWHGAGASSECAIARGRLAWHCCAAACWPAAAQLWIGSPW